MSLFNKKIKKLSSIYKYNDVFGAYLDASLMDAFDKNVQAILFNLYRVSDLIETCIDNIPDDVKSDITSEKIIAEVYKQDNHSDIDSEIGSDKFKTADKDWDEEFERFQDTLIEWCDSYDFQITRLNDIAQHLLDLRRNELPKAIANGKKAIDWNDIDTSSKNVIITYYSYQPVLFRYCQLNILDILNNTNRYEEIEKDYAAVNIKMRR